MRYILIALALLFSFLALSQRGGVKMRGKFEGGKHYISDLKGGRIEAERRGNQLFVNDQYVGDVVDR